MPVVEIQRLRAAIEAILWVGIPAGVLQRGTPAEEIDGVVRAHADLGPLPRSYFAKEAPRASVAVGAFTIAATPVTVGLWSLFASAVGIAPALAPRDHPIDGIWWGEAVGFCAWLTEQIAEPFRLPSETEWERAARGDDVREYPWGDRFESECANLAEAGNGTTAPAGSFPRGASPFGILDLAGNVDEWTATEYAPYPGAPPDVPARETWARDAHVSRGGSWRQHRDLARCARRHGVYPGNAGAGFRLVRGTRAAGS